MTRVLCGAVAVACGLAALSPAIATAAPYAVVPGSAAVGQGTLWDVGTVEPINDWREVTVITLAPGGEGPRRLLRSRLRISCFWPWSRTRQSEWLDASGAPTGAAIPGRATESGDLVGQGDPGWTLRPAVCAETAPAETHATLAAGVAALDAQMQPRPTEPAPASGGLSSGRATTGAPRFDYIQIADESVAALLVDWASRWRDGDAAGAIVLYAARRFPEDIDRRTGQVMSLRGMRYDCAGRTAATTAVHHLTQAGTVSAVSGPRPPVQVREGTIEQIELDAVCRGEPPGGVSFGSPAAAYRDFLSQPMS